MNADEVAGVAPARERRLPSGGDAFGVLAVIQFFLGGLVLFVAAHALMVGETTSYDGVVSLIGWAVASVIVAVVSMVAAFLIGLPVRLIPALRSRWLGKGELTVAGAVLGILACVIIIAVAPTSAAPDDLSVRHPNEWALIAAWSLFTLSVAHFVWPLRWRPLPP